MAKTSKSNQKNAATTSSSNKSNSNAIVKAKRTRKSVPRDSPPQRSSIYRGVTRHRWPADMKLIYGIKIAGMKRRIKKEDKVSTYEKELKEMVGQSKEEYIGSLRRHHHNGRWEARIGRVFGNKYLYLGTYATQEEAATAYDMAAIEYRGLNAVTNFDLSRYIKWLRPSDQINNVTINNPSNNTEPNPNHNTDDIHLMPNTKEDMTCSLLDHQQQSSGSDTIAAVLPLPAGGATASSALGLLLQSSMFKEMLERTSAAHCPETPSEPDRPRRSFPDDIQTYFDCQESSGFVEDHDIIFGDLDSLALPIFQCELDS
ncbi:hypothetical protein RND71_029477 [Anisodus tanguticus]|uniref:AP2/ERF domain-containing protein n=1 Tax=Anisodus tanguticus TaxID=243964 RepID=A0AAE1RF70_9SOLA|nr:hypothetical protein RND71_029477 [Anisodus tanguticus]